jgi:hypothetical protein
MVVLDRLSEHTLYLLSNCHCKRWALRVDGCGGAVLMSSGSAEEIARLCSA